MFLVFVTLQQCCGSGSGSGRICIILPDRHALDADPDPADPDRYQVQANEKVDKFNLFQKISLFSAKNTKKIYTFDIDDKDKLV